MQEMQKTEVQSLGREDPLGEEMATHSSILAWETPWTEEPGGLQSMQQQSWTRLSNWAYTHDSRQETCKIKIFSRNFNIILLKINTTDREVDGHSWPEKYYESIQHN